MVYFKRKEKKKKTSSHDLGKEILETKKSHDKISNAYMWCSSNSHPYPMNQLAT